MDSSYYFATPKYSYYKLFKCEASHETFFQRLGPTPPLFILLAKNSCYRHTQAKGTILLVRGRVVTFRPSTRGDPIWPVIVTICTSPNLYDQMTGNSEEIQLSPLMFYSNQSLLVRRPCLTQKTL